MHVGLNLVYLVPGYTGGTEVYARELIPELVRAAPGSRFTAFVNLESAGEPGAPWAGLIPAVTVPVNARNRVQWVRGEQLLLPRLAARAGVDLLHSLANTAPGWGPYRRVTTIHDLSHRLTADAHVGLLGPGMRVLVSFAVRRSDRIIVDSRSTQRDLGRLLKVRPGKVDVVPLGVRATGRGMPLAEPELRSMLDAGERPIVLCVAAKRPHKNLLRLLGAIALIPAERRPLLVLPGYPTPHEAELRARAGALALSSDVRFLDWVDTAVLEGLYAAAACFVFPSLLEGFGLPVLEAMARGVPVACSDRGSLPEVVGEAALLFDPESPASIAATIERLLSDPVEADRLRTAGHLRASEFSWARTAKATLASYERVLA